jgi:hypothetical protein
LLESLAFFGIQGRSRAALDLTFYPLSACRGQRLSRSGAAKEEEEIVGEKTARVDRAQQGPFRLNWQGRVLEPINRADRRT